MYVFILVVRNPTGEGSWYYCPGKMRKLPAASRRTATQPQNDPNRRAISLFDKK